MHLFFLLFAFLLPFLPLAAQSSIHWKHRGPVWFAPVKNTQIHGLAIGLVDFRDKVKYEKINGIGLEIGIGFFLPIGIGTPLSEVSSKEAAQRDTVKTGAVLNGISLSVTGSVHNYKINGLSLNGIGAAAGHMHGAQIALVLCEDWALNGLSLSIIANDAYYVRGVQISLVSNSSADHKGIQVGCRNAAKKMRGVQIGLFNKTRHLRGLQIGLWNVNGKRSMPLLNWGKQ